MAFLTDSQLDLLDNFSLSQPPTFHRPGRLCVRAFARLHQSRRDRRAIFLPSPSELCCLPSWHGAKEARQTPTYPPSICPRTPEGLSVNDGITKEDFSLQYVRVDDAIARIMQLGRGTLLAKFDIRRAFRLCPVRPEDWHLLGMCWEGKYYYDKVLPFGLRSAPFIFNEVAEAFQWICAHHLSIEDMLHLLDDFLVLGPPKSVLCEQRITLANVPLSGHSDC